LIPTLLETLGRPIPPIHGHSIWPLVRGEVEAVRPFAVSGLRVGAEETWLMRTLKWALHVPVDERPPQLFVKPADRWEVNDLCQQQIEIVEPMTAELRTFVRAQAPP
jgi:hypothetical protein